MVTEREGPREKEEGLWESLCSPTKGDHRLVAVENERRGKLQELFGGENGRKLMMNRERFMKGVRGTPELNLRIWA